jgi:hypothetical protein
MHPTEDQAALAVSKYASQSILPAAYTCSFWCFWLSVVLDLYVLPAAVHKDIASMSAYCQTVMFPQGAVQDWPALQWPA